MHEINDLRSEIDRYNGVYCRTRGARVEDAVQAIKQLHTDFSWPLPILTHSAFYKSLRSRFFMLSYEKDSELVVLSSWISAIFVT